MKNIPIRDQVVSRLRLSLYLMGAELLVAGTVTALAAARQHSATATVLAVLMILAGASCVLLPSVLNHHPGLEQRSTETFRSPRGQLAPAAMILALGAFVIWAPPDPSVALSWAPALICGWLIGAQFLILFHSGRTGEPEALPTVGRGRRNWLAFFVLLLAYSAALIPIRIPAILDGIPWDTPVEFVYVMLLLPLAFIVAHRFFATRVALLLTASLLILKVVLAVFLPQAGLGVRAYSSKEALSLGRWEKSYSTLITASYTQVAQAPYYSFREFPIEWINQAGLKPEEFSSTLELSGSARLQKDERLAFIVQGAKQAQIEMVEDGTGRSIPAVLVENPADVTAHLYQTLPASTEFKIYGILTFKRFSQSRIEPVLVRPNGSAQSALSTLRIWIGPNAPHYSSGQLTAVLCLADFVGVSLVGLALILLLVGVADSYRTQHLSPADLFMATSGCLAFFVAGLVFKPHMNTLIISIISVLASLKLIDLLLSRRQLAAKAFLFSMGIAFLAAFFTLEISDLRRVYVFPQGQDGLEYQALARSIFVHGDPFLAQTTPRAYKVLFPYLVGLLHVVFGQSVSAQSYLNVWCALISTVMISQLMKDTVTPYVAFLASSYFLLVLCLSSIYVFYFRFGLIEPVGVLFLLATLYFANKRRGPQMIAAGILTVLCRLDYLGLVVAAVILRSAPIVGPASIAWRQASRWLGQHWRLLTGYAASVCAPPLLIIAGYSALTPNYLLNASDTQQTSLASILESLLRVILGGNLHELLTRFTNDPGDALLTTIPLAAGFLIAIATICIRRGIFEKMDLRLGLLVPSILPAYVLFRPAGYFPRFSLSVLPLDLIIIALFVQAVLSRKTIGALG